MQVRVGWSGETGTNVWQKADVTLGEDDLQRILVHGDVPIETSLPTAAVYKLLSNEAEFLLLGQLKQLGYPEDKASSRQSVLNNQNQAILSALKKTQQ